MTKNYITECLERAEKATEGPYHVERIDHDHGEIAYEINDKHHLVAFYESNFKKPMKAKFNAEFYAHARTDVVELATRLKKACKELNEIEDGGYVMNYKSLRELINELEAPLQEGK